MQHHFVYIYMLRILQSYKQAQEFGMINIIIPVRKEAFPDLNLTDGTLGPKSYAIVARRGDVFLGIKFSGLADGTQFGLPDKAYLNVLLRSARNQDLAAKLD